ncbi:hypothetical protein M3D75_05250 [Microbacterium enclense]|uniref:hypothetical protein n=1 Tax=Microbacterium enclense TaxID=993073 RepID=UPI0021A36B59|nr:hypothetical protein [Microbacterium enclense]MCT2085517.1 hypothetical protein [Microbacterium enclense]
MDATSPASVAIPDAQNSGKNVVDGCRRSEARQDAGVVLARNGTGPRESATANSEGRRENPAPFGS